MNNRRVNLNVIIREAISARFGLENQIKKILRLGFPFKGVGAADRRRLRWHFPESVYCDCVPLDAFAFMRRWVTADDRIYGALQPFTRLLISLASTSLASRDCALRPVISWKVFDEFTPLHAIFKQMYDAN